MLSVPSYFYTRSGKFIYWAIFTILSFSSVLRLYILHGYVRLYYSHMATLELTLVYICCIQTSVFDFLESFGLYIIQLVIYLVFNILKYRSVTTSGGYLFDYILFFIVIGFYLNYNNYSYIQTEIRWYNTEGQTSKKKEMIQDFILRLIPKHLSSQIGSAELSLGSSYNNVTMLFADIVGFTAYSADKTPKEVVRMLSKLFTAFDKECNKLQLYKVYTIGDCYVVMSFLDGNDRIEPEQECADVVELGFSMIEIIAKVRKEVNFDGLHMRIGIHTGTIIGGIVGTDIIRFDLYGSDVLIANKMESNGQQDRIHISQSSKELLDKVNKNRRYLFTPNGETEIKALNRKVGGYFVDKNVQQDIDSSES